ncbi:MAG: HAMP domain-containing histidine kinase [Actinobacteria bacterium]|nr:HAMP domain-containing histidine kinase [Actinomycetota bacterium]
MRTVVRISRALLGTALFGVAAAAWAAGTPGARMKTLVAVLVVLHALVDRPRRSALPALTIDALLLCSVAGVGVRVNGPVAAVLAYLLAAAALLLPRRHLPIVLVAMGGGAALRLMVWSPPNGLASDFDQAAAWIESGFYLAALSVLTLGAARAVTLGRHRQAEALEAEHRAAAVKNEFVSMVSHELRTPLTNIAGFALALRESWRTFDPAEVDEFLDLVCREAEHLKALVDDVLVVPRLEAGRLPIEVTDFALGPAAFRIANLVFPPGGEKSVAVSVSGSAVVRADPNRVEQVLRNLLENASRHGGAQVTVESALVGGEWLVVVADDGPGVSEDQQERIFSPFEQGKPGGGLGLGLGLGLSVSRVLVEAMGGRIWYEPGFPAGARFCFTLPAAEVPRNVPVSVPS